MSKIRFRFLSSLIVIALLTISSCARAPDESDTAVNTPTTTNIADSPVPDSAEIVEITLLSNWGMNQDRGVVLQELVDEYNQQHADQVEINLEVNPDWPALQSKIRTMIGSDQTPDFFNYNYNPNDLSIPESGKLLDFSPYMDNEWRERFHPEDLDALTIDGKLVSIPFEQTPVLFYYNMDLLSKAGINEFPRTWDHLFEACESLKESDTACVSLMTKDDAWHATNAFTYLVASLGGPDVFAVGNSLDTPAVVQAAERLKNLFEYSTPDAVGANYEVSSNNFLLGKSAIIIDGPWLIGPINDQMEAGKIGVAGGPAAGSEGEAGLIITDAVTPWASGIQDDENKEQAIAEFMKFFTSEESARRFALDGNFPLSTKVNLTDDEIEQADPLLVGVIEASNNAPSKAVQVTRILKPGATAELPALLESLILDQISPEEFASQLQSLNQ